MEPDTPPALPEVLFDRLGFLLGRAHLSHREIAESRFATLGIAPKEFGALSVIANEGPLSQQRLGQRTGIDRTTMVAVTEQLERKGLVSRERNPDDRRAYVLSATRAGRRLLARATTAAVKAEDEFLAPLSTNERQQLRAMLRRLIQD